MAWPVLAHRSYRSCPHMVACTITVAYLASILMVLTTSTGFIVEALQLRLNKRVTLMSSPLIGGPAWLPLHCKMIVDDSHVFDFIPLKATSVKTIKNLVTLQEVPATVRIVQTNDNNRSDGNFVDQKDVKISDDGEKQYVERAIQFCEDYERDLHLIRNNCWSFAFDLFQNISSPEETVSLL